MVPLEFSGPEVEYLTMFVWTKKKDRRSGQNLGCDKTHYEHD